MKLTTRDLVLIAILAIGTSVAVYFATGGSIPGAIIGLPIGAIGGIIPGLVIHSQRKPGPP